MAVKPPKLPPVYFSAKTSGYWLRLDTGRFLKLDKRDVALHLRHAGLNPEEPCGPLTALEKCYFVAQTERAVDYAGPLAGHRVGEFKTTAGERILVTSECAPAAFQKPTKPKGDCDFIESYLGALLGNVQVQSALLWMKFAVAALRDGDFRPGQMLVLAGPPECGKSFFHWFVTELLGGRMGKPYLWMSGKTPFNADWCGCESLVIEDEQCSTDIRSRLAFKATIKQLTVNEQMHVHPKGTEAIVLPTYRRLTLSVNEEPENLMILPPMDEDLLGKVMLFRCTRDAVGLLSENREENKRRVIEELPAFRDRLNALRCPERLRNGRFGVAAYHDPGLLEAVWDIAPESRLLNLIDEIVFSGRDRETSPIRCTADNLERRLRASSFMPAVEKLLTYTAACGVYLARLQAKKPDRVASKRSRGKTIWIVQPPEQIHEVED